MQKDPISPASPSSTSSWVAVGAQPGCSEPLAGGHTPRDRFEGSDGSAADVLDRSGSGSDDNESHRLRVLLTAPDLSTAQARLALLRQARRDPAAPAASEGAAPPPAVRPAYLAMAMRASRLHDACERGARSAGRIGGRAWQAFGEQVVNGTALCALGIFIGVCQNLPGFAAEASMREEAMPWHAPVPAFLCMAATFAAICHGASRAVDDAQMARAFGRSICHAACCAVTVGLFCLDAVRSGSADTAGATVADSRCTVLLEEILQRTTAEMFPSEVRACRIDGRLFHLHMQGYEMRSSYP